MDDQGSGLESRPRWGKAPARLIGLIAVTALLVAVGGTAALMSTNRDRAARADSSATATATAAASASEFDAPTDYILGPSDEPSAEPASEQPSVPSSPASSAPKPTTPPHKATPTPFIWASPSMPTLPPASRTIAGRITNRAGQPLGGIKVYVVGQSVEAGYQFTTAGDGRYSVWVVAATYYVSTSDPSGTYGDVYYGATGTSYGSLATDIDVTAGDALSIDLILPPAIHVVVKVIDADGKPVAGVKCHLVQNIPETIAFTNAQGLATWIVRPANYFVYIDSTGGNYGTPEFVVNEDSADLYYEIVIDPSTLF
jgi:hypothetical protein